VALVASRQTLQCGEQGYQRPGNSSAFATQEFPDVGILLLRHEAAASRKFVGKDDVGQFLRGKDYEVFGEPGKMCGDAGERQQIIDSEVAIAHGVYAVWRDSREAKVARNLMAVNAETVAGERARAHGAGVGAFRG